MIDYVIRLIEEEIEILNQALRLLTGTGAKKTKVKQPKAPTRKISAAGRMRIAAAQRARWRKIRAGKK